MSSNWRSGAIVAGESLWSVIHKYAYLNRVGGREIRDLVNATAAQTPDLRWHDWMHEEKACKAFRSSGYDLFLGSVSAFYFRMRQMPLFPKGDDEHAMEESASRRKWAERRQSYPCLRYCPECIRVGFHSAAFQMAWIDACPIHGGKLKTGCPSCGENLPYKLSASALRVPYGCAHCSQVLWEAIDSNRWSKSVGDEQASLILKYAGWVQAISGAGRFVPYTIFNPDQSGRLGVSLLAAIGSVLPQPGNALRQPAGEVRSHVMEVRRRRLFRNGVARPDTFVVDLDGEMRATFKSAMRYLVRRYCRGSSKRKPQCALWDENACMWSRAIVLWERHMQSGGWNPEYYLRRIAQRQGFDNFSWADRMDGGQEECGRAEWVLSVAYRFLAESLMSVFAQMYRIVLGEERQEIATVYALLDTQEPRLVRIIGVGSRLPPSREECPYRSRTTPTEKEQSATAIAAIRAMSERIYAPISAREALRNSWK